MLISFFATFTSPGKNSFFFSWSYQGKWECRVNCCQWNHNFLWICCYLIKYNIMERHNMPFYISDIVHPFPWPQQFCFMVVDGCTKSRDLSYTSHEVLFSVFHGNSVSYMWLHVTGFHFQVLRFYFIFASFVMTSNGHIWGFSIG